MARRWQVVPLQGFINERKLVNVHLKNGKIFRGVRFVGFTEDTSPKSGIPYQLSRMAVCETETGAKILLRADAIQTIEELEGPA
jgi:hypothetical protein